MKLKLHKSLNTLSLCIMIFFPPSTHVLFVTQNHDHLRNNNINIRHAAATTLCVCVCIGADTSTPNTKPQNMHFSSLRNHIPVSRWWIIWRLFNNISYTTQNDITRNEIAQNRGCDCRQIHITVPHARFRLTYTHAYWSFMLFKLEVSCWWIDGPQHVTLCRHQLCVRKF